MKVLIRGIAVFLLLGCVCSCSSGEKPLQPQDSDTKAVDQKMLDYYRTHSPWTDPGTHQAMFDGIPDDIHSIVESVQGVLIHGGLVWLYELEPTEGQDNVNPSPKSRQKLGHFKMDSSPC
jgi:hypothetical protein